MPLRTDNSSPTEAYKAGSVPCQGLEEGEFNIFLPSSMSKETEKFKRTYKWNPLSWFLSTRNRLEPDLSQFRKLSFVEEKILHARLWVLLRRYKRDGPVFRYSRNTVVKRKLPQSLRLTEAITQQFIAKNTTIPVPRVYDVFSAFGQNWILMDYIDAPMLLDVWEGLSEEEKLACMLQLKGYINQLRALQPPQPGKVEAVDGQAWIDTRFHGRRRPFETIEEFHRFCGHEHVSKNYPQYRDDFDKVAGRTYRTVFTHGDLGPHNILWKDGEIVAIIDWETAGWLPEYWEYMMSGLGPTIPSWWEMYDRIMERYPDEMAVEVATSQVFVRA